MSKNKKLEWLDCSYNQLRSLDLSNNTKLKTLWCNSNSLGCIKVSQEQLNNTEKNWKKDDWVIYNTNCN